MGSANLEMGMIFLTQTGVGILGNSFLFCFTWLAEHKLRLTDLIINQLVLANNLVLFSKGILQTVAAFGLKFFLHDAGCKFVFYLHRVGRGVSLSTTSLLSSFQAIKLNSSFSRWMEPRIRSPKCIGFCCFLCWILHLLANTYIPMRVTGQVRRKNISLKRFGYCSLTIQDSSIVSVFTITYVFVDMIFLGLKVWASGSMVLVLHRHKQQVHHIHSHSLSPRPSHEARATHAILVLVSAFVSFYSVSSILTLCFTLIVNPSQWLMDTSVLMAACFPAFSPFVLISSDTRVSRFSLTCWTKKTFFSNLVKQLQVF
ncbi:PREDICTED: vomeronasal type-1 receptor 1-like [Ceratotherium simum simum]|uniref:Vomeronasal type-1 receptor n=1 Tax=Ceratotherium simum simum TaxID=73337 RepID=A0ABM0I343_CERSS|nr:PREDICTED: vomeronasal type-1 receptor 1-like [Ceratotherium simum simum]